MIITPKELQSWIKQGKNFTVFDVRPDDKKIVLHVYKIIYI